MACAPTTATQRKIKANDAKLNHISCLLGAVSCRFADEIFFVLRCRTDIEVGTTWPATVIELISLFMLVAMRAKSSVAADIDLAGN